MSKKLEASLKKIELVFEKMYRKGNTPIGRRWSERTKNTYTDMMKAFAREAHVRFGVSDFSKIKEEQVNQLIQERIDAYHEGDTRQSYNLKTLISAMTAFNRGIQDFNVYKKKFTVGDPNEIRKTMKEKNVLRKSKSSSVLRATPSECQSVLDNIKNMGYRTETREMAYRVGKIAMETGGRISAILKLRAGDISIDEKRNSIVFRNDKGGLTREVAISRDTAEYLKHLISGKKSGERLFSLKRSDGTFKSVEETRKEVTRVISDAGRHLERIEKVTIKDKVGNKKVVEVRQKFSPHSFRKSFALERTKFYHDKFTSRSSVNRYVFERIKDNPDLKKKLNAVRERINKSRTTNRDLTPEEYAIFFASVDLGHFRNDVITAFYTTFKEVEAYCQVRLR